MKKVLGKLNLLMNKPNHGKKTIQCHCLTCDIIQVPIWICSHSGKWNLLEANCSDRTSTTTWKLCRISKPIGGKKKNLLTLVFFCLVKWSERKHSHVRCYILILGNTIWLQISWKNLKIVLLADGHVWIFLNTQQ